MSFFCFLQRAVSVLLCLSVGAVAAQTLPVATPAPAPNLPWLEQMLHESVVLGRHNVGVCLTDATTGQQLFGQNEDRYFTPASTMKLFSLYAGLRMLPDSLPALRYVLRPDTLLFWGTGDPTLLHGDVPSRRALVFLKNRPEKLVYAEVPTGTAFGPGWSWDDYNYYFQPERGAFPLYGHTVRFYAKAGQPLPRVYPRFFRPLTEAAPAGTSNLADDHVRRAQLENRFMVFPSTKNWVDETPFRTSPTLLLQLLQDTLRRPVVQAPFRLRPQDAVYTLRGLPVDSLYRRMIRVSDNFLAEQLLLMCTSTLSPDSLSAARVIKAMQANYLRSLPDRTIWVDGSGLSRLNLTTPRTLTALLVRLHQEVEEPRLLSLLATGGGQGTLRRRYRPVAGKPWLWGKTGTLTNNHNLVGYVRTKSGQLLAFSFFNNNIPGDDAPVRNEMERILTQVRERL